MATLTPTGATGTGTETLTFNLGSNTSGSVKTYSFKLRESGSSTIADTLTVTQPSSGVDVTGVTLTPTQVTINRGNAYNDVFSVIITPSNASDKTISWSSDDSSEVMVNGSGEIRGMAVTSTPVGVWAEAHNGISDVSYVTVVEPGTITLSDVNKLTSDTSAEIPVSLFNIDTDRPITASVTSGTSWVTNVGSYDSSHSTITINISANRTGIDRSTTVTVRGYDLAGVLRTGTATLSQNGQDNIQLLGISVSGPSVISDHGESTHQYVVTYDPSDTSEVGVSWDVVDANSGTSVVGTVVSIDSSSSTYCRITALSGANNNSVLVKATSTVRPNKYGQCAVTVTYVPVLAELQVSPDSVDNVQWDATSNSEPVVTWNSSGVQGNPYIANGAWTGFITGATINTTSGVVTATFSENSSTSSRSGSVTISAMPINGVDPVSVTVNYTQGGKPDPTTTTSMGVSNLSVTNGAHSSLSAKIHLQNNNNYNYTFPGEYYWTLYGYESSDPTDVGTETVITSGTETGYTTTVAAHTNATINLDHGWLGTVGMSTYFKIKVSMAGYPDAYDDYDPNQVL